MDFVGSIQAGFKNYANFRGVATRAEFWYFQLFIVLVSLVLSVIDRLFPIGVLGLGFSLVTVLPSLSLLVRRLRDAGFSWLWILAPLLSVAVLFAGMFGTVKIGVEAGIFDWSQLASGDDVLFNQEAATVLANDPNFMGFVALLLIGLVGALIFGLIVQIIFPLLPSKSAAEGNKRIKAETL